VEGDDGEGVGADLDEAAAEGAAVVGGPDVAVGADGDAAEDVALGAGDDREGLGHGSNTLTPPWPVQLANHTLPLLSVVMP
jgi:hypothetical protein